MGKLSFFVGAGIGYLLGARAGRQQFDKIKSASQQVWENPRVQSSVHKVEEKVSQVAKDQGSALTDKVAETVKSRIGGNGGASSRSGDSTSGSLDAGRDDAGHDDADGSPMRPTPPQPEI